MVIHVSQGDHEVTDVAVTQGTLGRMHAGVSAGPRVPASPFLLLN